MDPTQPSASAKDTNAVQDSFTELCKQRQVVARQLATVLCQLHTIDDAIDAMRPTALNEVIQLELTKGEAALFMGVCFNVTNRTPEFGTQTCETINELGTRVMKALYYQNPRFAEGITELLQEREAAERKKAHGPKSK